MPRHVTSITGWRTFGDLYLADGHVQPDRYLPHDEQRLPRLLGKQQVVELHDLQAME